MMARLLGCGLRLLDPTVGVMKGNLTFQCKFKEFMRKVSGPFVLTTSLYLFINSGHKILAHFIQQRHKVPQHLRGDHLLVENHSV